MEADTVPKLPPIYVSKRKGVRTDVLTRQALIPPIFRRREPAKREAKYSRVHSNNATNCESEASAHDLYRNSLYAKYKTEFNYLSPELMLNKKCSESVHSESKRSHDYPDNGTPNVDKRRKAKIQCTDAPHNLPKSPWLDRVLPILLHLIRSKDEAKDSLKTVTDEVMHLYKAGRKVDESTLRDTATTLCTIVNSIDDWCANAKNAISQRITIEEARSLMEDFRELSGGLVKVDLATDIDNDIKTCEAFGAKVRMTMTILSSSAERMVSLDKVEALLQESRHCRFLVPEVVALQSIFRNLTSIHSLIERSVLDLDVSQCESLVSVCEKGLVRLPRLDELRRHLQESVWLHSATKVCQRQVKYSLAKSLVETVPEVLREHSLYNHIKQKCVGVEQWLERISQYSFFQMLTSDNTYNGPFTMKDTTSPVVHRTNEVVWKKCDVRTFEELCTNYHKLELTLPVFRSIEPLYQSLKRLQRRLHKIESMLDSNSRNPNMATDCIWLLQHSEPLSELIDLTEYLHPIRSGVEMWLNYEKKCRKVLDTVKTFTLSKEVNHLKSDWTFLLNFRKTTKLSDSDIVGLLELMRSYEDEERVTFAEIEELEREFGDLRIKNLVLQREITEIYQKGLNLLSKVETAIENVKTDTSKSDSVLSHLVLVILGILKFGTRLDCMTHLILCLEYLRWSRMFYPFLFSSEVLADGGERLRELAKEGTKDVFHVYTQSVVVHENVLSHMNSLGRMSIQDTTSLTESEFLRLLTM